MPVLDAADAANLIKEQLKVNVPASQLLRQQLEVVRALNREHYCLICNVGPWMQQIQRTVWSDLIPAYDPAKDTEKLGYTHGRPVPLLFQHPKLGEVNEFEGSNHYDWLEDDGYKVALDLIGIGPGMDPNRSMLREGVFVTKGKTPTVEDVTAAKANLTKYAQEMVNEARDASIKGVDAERAVIGDRHRWASNFLNIDERWAKKVLPLNGPRCPSCGKVAAENVALCTCGEIVNEELHLANLKRRKRLEQQANAELEEERLDAETAPPAKKR